MVNKIVKIKTVETQTAGGVVVNKKGRILVVNQRGTSWSLPKGHIEPGEDKFAGKSRGDEGKNTESRAS